MQILAFLIAGLIGIGPADDEAAASAAEVSVPVTGARFSEDGAVLEVVTPAARWRFSMTAGVVMAHEGRGDGAVPAALPEKGLVSPDGTWTVQAMAPIPFTDPAWSHLRLSRKEEGKAAGVLALGPEGAWILLPELRWGYHYSEPLFSGNAAALVPRCVSWRYPYRTFAQTTDHRKVTELMGFAGAALEAPAALAPVDGDMACAAHFEGVPKRWDLEKELAAIVARAGGELRIADGELRYWREKGEGYGYVRIELGEIFAIDPVPPLSRVFVECGYWDVDRQGWRMARCGKQSNDPKDSIYPIHVNPDDFPRFAQLMDWLLRRRGEYGRPIRMM